MGKVKIKIKRHYQILQWHDIYLPGEREFLGPLIIHFVTGDFQNGNRVEIISDIYSASFTVPYLHVRQC